MPARPAPPGPGQESVWDYPRPPRLEPTGRRLEVVLGGRVVASTTRGLRLLETSHPPTYYFPPEDVDRSCLEPLERASTCEWKGRGAWCYPQPVPAFAALRDFVAFHARGMDACRVDGEVVTPQAGGFYGGWITSDLVGPFKGEPGTWGW
jgi:uncharacterized protein (DUF427 family)